MSTAELKNVLHKLIVETNDVDILENIMNYIHAIKKKNIDWWDSISDEEKKLINKGIQQYKDGQTSSHKEVRNQIDQILNKK